MRALIAIHEKTEGPGTLGTFLATRGAVIESASLYEGYKLPATAEGYDAIISMGGPMNVYEEDNYPFLKDETVLLHDAIQRGCPVLGVCLGAQMIAKAAGARVTDSPKKEVGWLPVHITDSGSEDLLFRGLPGTLEVFQWHGDMFHIPQAGSLLATGDDCPHQAFRVANAYGLQFHVEVTRDILASWFANDVALEGILRRHSEIEVELNMQAERMYNNFFSLLR